MLWNAYKRYLQANETRPLLTKCLTASTLMGLGDFICQSIEVRYTEKDSIDRSRLFSFTTYGFALYGPLLYTTYNNILPMIAPGKGWKSIGKKLIFTQTIFTCFSMCAFYTMIPVF